MKRTSGALEKIRAGLEDAVAYHREGRRLTVRDVQLHAPPQMGSKQIAKLRAQLRVSQAAFARLLNVSPRTVQAWESDLRRPSDAALKLLHVAKRHPEILFEADSAA